MNMRTPKCLLLLPLLVLCACGVGPDAKVNAPQQSAGKPSRHVPSEAAQDTLRNGHERVLRPDGSLMMEGDKLDGGRNGVWTSYNGRGAVQSRNDYVKGVLQGQSIVFRSNGSLYYTGQHRNGKQVGEWKFYDEKGNLAKTVEYDTTGNVMPGR